MYPAHMRTVPNLAQLLFGTLFLVGLLTAGLVWSMLQ